MIQADCDVAAEAEAMEHYLSKSTISSIELLMVFMQENPEVYQRFIDHVQAAKQMQQE